MKLIILLIVLGLERYLGVGEKLKRFAWFPAYLDKLDEFLGKKHWFRGLPGAAITIAVLPLFVTLICWLLSAIAGHGVGGLVWMVLSIAVLLYCLGPYDLYRQVQAYIDAKEKHATEVANVVEGQLLDGASGGESHALTKAIFWQSNQSLYGVFFWYMLFGIFGALFYRYTVLVRQTAEKHKSHFSSQSAAAKQIQNVLDWLPVRIFMLYFALVGQFSASFTYWLENIVSGLNNNRKLIADGGLIALGISKNVKSSENTEEYHAALSLVDRALIIFLAIVALFTLGSWVY